MKISLADQIERRRVQAASAYRFVPIEAVSELDRFSLPQGGAGSGWAGALVPAEPGWRRVQLITPETAALLSSLDVEPRMPAGFDLAVFARLVLDGILELECENSFLSGPLAHGLFFPPEPPVPEGTVARLSLAALQYATALGNLPPRHLTERLYRYNTLPISPEWRRRLPDTKAVARALEAGAPPRPRLRRNAPVWTTFTSAEPVGPVWEVWERSGAPVPHDEAPTYKLYLSPHVAGVGEASRALRALPAPCAPFALKLGGDLPTLLRSEKLVAYYLELDQLLEGAARLSASLRGMPPQGVPFTVELDAGALLTWGADPGDVAEPPGPLRQTSWRRWITARLGTALATALAAGAPVPAWHYALDRVALEGVDSRRWTPPAWFFRGTREHADH